MHRSQKKLVLGKGRYADESGVDNTMYEGGRRGTKRTWEDYDDGKLIMLTRMFRPRKGFRNC